MWNCKIDEGETLQASYPELHIGKGVEDTYLQVHGNIRHIGDDTLRIVGGGLQFQTLQSGTLCIQSLDDGTPVKFDWVGILLDNDMHIAEKVILQTKFPNNGPVVTLSASREEDTLSIDVVGGGHKIQIKDHDVLDIVVERTPQILRELG